MRWRQVAGTRLIAIEDCVELAVRELEVHVHGSEERLPQAARGDRIDGLEAANVLKSAKKENRLEDWKKKSLHGQYLRQTKEVRSEQSWVWLQNGDLNRETEVIIVTPQNHSIRTNLVKVKVDKSQKDTVCRLCKKPDKSSKLAPKEYKRMHDNLGKIVHWKRARKCNFEAGDKWYEHEPESDLERMKVLKSCGISAFRLIML